MKLLISIAAAVMMATSAVQAQEDIKTIYVRSNSSTYWHTAKPFKNVHVGDDKLLTVNPGATNRDLIIVAHRPPKDSFIDSSEVLLTDDQGDVVDKIYVEVTPFEAPSSTVTIMMPSDRNGNDRTTVNQCSSSRCVTISGPQSGSGLGDADAVSQTNFRDGSSIVTKSWRFKP
jgi:hypothetical protein